MSRSSMIPRRLRATPTLLADARQDLIDLMRGERVRLARFARAIDAFPTPIGFFNNLVTSKADGDALDLKKGGVFPIVHGVRALALEHGLHETNTAKRIARLAEQGLFDAPVRARTDAGAALSDDAEARRADRRSRLGQPGEARRSFRPWIATCCATLSWS